MSSLPDWLPELILLDDYDGCGQRYEDEIYSQFYADFIQSKPVFQYTPVHVTKQLIRGKERAFWHCIQEGRIEEKRTPDLRRCERIGWVRAIIEHADDPIVKKWQDKRGRHLRQLLWLEQAEFLVVLEKRKNSWLLWTAYCTNWDRTKRMLRRQYEQSLKKPTPP
jgi:hypothetical protein